MVQKILKGYKKKVWKELDSYLKSPTYPKAFDIPQDYSSVKGFHWQLCRDYPERKGKYLRPVLLLLTAEAMGANFRNAIKTAAAMQISEDWLLIHDDLEDKSLERRGQPTLHRIYGAELAINAGDTLQTVMWKIIFDNRKILGNKKTEKIADEFYKILSRTELGQTTEIKWTKDNKLNFSDKDWFFICDGKTSCYTIAGPMRLGAIIAGSTDSQLEILAEFGIYLGRCFQLVDDILDVTSNFKGLKKQKGNDIYEGKRTVILGHLLRTARKEDKRKIAQIISKAREEKSQKEVDWIISKMNEYESIKYARKIAEKYSDKAKKIFSKELRFLSKQPVRKNLLELIDFILEREY